MTKPHTIFITDDHTLFRDGLKAIISRNKKFEVIGEAGTFKEAINALKKLKPDLAIVDITLPDRSGVELIREIRRDNSDMRIIVVSMHSKSDYVVKAFQAGATGYVVKESASERLIEGVDAVLRGEYYMDGSVSQEVIKKLMDNPDKEARLSDSAYGSLTQREQEIMALLAEGMSTKKVADTLFISRKTVENHKSNIMNKLNVHSTVELVRYAARIGIIDIDLWKK